MPFFPDPLVVPDRLVDELSGASALLHAAAVHSSPVVSACFLRAISAAGTGLRRAYVVCTVYVSSDALASTTEHTVVGGSMEPVR